MIDNTYEKNVLEHMSLQAKLMKACGVYGVSRAIEITLLAMAGEALESIGYILDATKPWKAVEFNVEATQEEVIDIYHFYLQLLILTGSYDYSFKSPEKFRLFESKPKDLTSFENACKMTVEEAAELSRWSDDEELSRFILIQWYRMLTMFQSLEMSPEDVDRIYREKNAKNFNRIKEKLGGN